MKNIQIVDGASNCVYDVFAATEKEFSLIFPKDTDIAFIGEVYAKAHDHVQLNYAFEQIWKRRLRKADVEGIHGTLFYQLDEKKLYYPTRKDEEAINPNGSSLR